MRNLTLTTVSTLGAIPPIRDITDQLPRRKRWEELKKPYRHKGHWDGKTYHTGFRRPEDIDTIIIHHSGPPEGTLQTHANSHARKWGAGLAYHVCIDRGAIYQTNDLRSFTYHVGNHNTYTVGIMVNRDLRNYDLTEQERRLLYAAILSVKAVLPIQYILGHNDLNATACPVTSVERIRRDIEALEEQLNYEKGPDADTALIVALQSRVKDLESKLEPNHMFYAPALYKSQLFTGILDAQGFSQPGVNAFQRINSMYQTFLKPGEFQAEARRKLIIIAQEAKKMGLIA